MAISLGFINLFVPIKVITEKYPGGLEQFRKDYAHQITYDEHLARYCSGHPNDIRTMVEQLDKLGFDTVVESADGQAYWKDCCVVEHFGNLTLPCDWLQVLKYGRGAYLKGTDPSEIVDVPS
ncbi:hypothetical protein [Zoogloea sp.]|uniref:hypothetical protein n=1 Tax=Zoogloea sp. TaxID=49181 RepID=UPI0035B352E3